MYDIYLLGKMILESIASDTETLENDLQTEVQELQELEQKIGQLLETQQLTFLDTTLTVEQHENRVDDSVREIWHLIVNYRQKIREFTRKLNSQKSTGE